MADDATANATAGYLIDRYRVEGLLGEGGLGTVVKAFDTRLKRMVAIKTLKRDAYTADPERFRAAEERFAREAEAGSRMGSHPYIVGIHDLVIDAHRTQYLILEYLPGGTLAERITRGPLPLADAFRFAAEIARGLQAAHKMGLVHRDIKPANVFLTAEEQAKVGDFGIAQIDDLSGRTRSTSGHPGTPLYMSPEQERMTAYLWPASDQYSLGLILFELLTGQVYKRIGIRQAVHLLAKQPATVTALVTRMLAEEPDDRYPAMDDVIHAILTIERQRANAETQLPTRDGGVAPPLDDARTLPVTRHDTPRLWLQPVAQIAAPPPPVPSMSTRYSRRAVLIGAGGLVLAAGTGGALLMRQHETGTALATTTPAAAAIALATAAIPVSTPTSAPLPTATAIPAVAAPIVITAPPIIITATPMPTALPTPTPLAPPTVEPTATPLPTEPPRSPTATVVLASRQAQQVRWTDPQGRFQIGYPSGWQVTQNPRPSVIEFDGLNIGVEVTAYVDATRTPAQQIDNIRTHRKPGRRYEDGPTRSTVVGGEPGAFMQYKSYGIGSTTDLHEGAFWIVIHAGTSFQFEGFTLVPLTDDEIHTLDAIVASVTFLR